MISFHRLLFSIFPCQLLEYTKFFIHFINEKYPGCLLESGIKASLYNTAASERIK